MANATGDGEGLDIPEVDHVVFYEPVPSEIRYIQRRGITGRRVAGKVTILIAEDTVDEAFYWSSISRARKMKRIISQPKQEAARTLERESRANHNPNGLLAANNAGYNSKRPNDSSRGS